jgi:hypothetical protein
MEATCSFETSAFSELYIVTSQNNILFTNTVAVKPASPYRLTKVQESSIEILKACLMLGAGLAHFPFCRSSKEHSSLEAAFSIQ